MATKNAIYSANPIEVAFGGTGNASLSVTHAVLCGGSTATSALQTVASIGSSGQILQSQGSAALPQFVTLSALQNFQVVSSDPSSPSNGQVWYNSTDDDYKGYANGATVTFTVT